MAEHKLEIVANQDLHVDDALQTALAAYFTPANRPASPALYAVVKTQLNTGGDYDWDAAPADPIARTADNLVDCYEVWTGGSWVTLRLNDIVDPWWVTE